SNDMGADPEVSGFVLPLGATINMDGTAIYQGVAAVFIATCYGIDLTIGQMAMIVLTATLASIGTAGVSGAGMIMLAMVLETVGLPVEGIALIAGVDKLFDMGRTTLNIVGDSTCALYMTKLDQKRSAKKLAKAGASASEE
ncbi:MAG: dicarboxylate/amino acid:cation symporter, partial [Oscillospiraceae bacterium]|nr:dicarboxylate/amino acid:cation symporter [Oscillospiraceae bacterium]